MAETPLGMILRLRRPTTTGAGRDPFQNRAHEYAAYLETPLGRLRSDLAFAAVQEFLPVPEPARRLRALDIGCGPGTTGVRLAQLGAHVTMLDSSPAMLDLADRAAREAGVAARIALKHGDAADALELLRPESFDVIVCHNVLEYVDDPGAVLSGLAELMQPPSAILSVIVRNQAGEALKAAIQTGDLALAERLLTADRVSESLFGQTLRLFTPASLRGFLQETSLGVIAERGIRTVSDYLPETVNLTGEYERILQLERQFGARPDFAALARYVCYVVRHTGR